MPFSRPAQADNIPGNLTWEPASKNSVLLRWQEPKNPNGLILKYEIKYSRESEVRMGSRGRRRPRRLLGIAAHERLFWPPLSSASLQKVISVLCVSRHRYARYGGYHLALLQPGNYSARVRATSLAGNGSWTSLMSFYILGGGGSLSRLAFLKALFFLEDVVLIKGRGGGSLVPRGLVNAAAPPSVGRGLILPTPAVKRCYDIHSFNLSLCL